MMDVRKVRMLMHHHLVPVRVLMRLVPVPREIVFVLVMHVVRVPMAMLHRLMHMFVLVMLGEVQPHTPAHQRRAIQNAIEVDSPSRSSDTAAPMKGAVEK